ncbi:tetratricopeptide repeat protein [Bacillus cereus]|uniref:tetratricopeptide repeat protein n=1 Tax=Bacillus cereus TaxID=1396 RepID=UPI0011588244|nr:tetratricopeptide repeat protein [Bacillus cereus]MCU4791614.1 tetratricopeptide repeat protein [Bacillus cereus]MDA2297974.1 tetratricopeptide repeat protein [Bacillus cereus]MDA2304680.1 tetratricopeptide repeat protein [Bacillus cereus]TQR50144.1 molecular chaperone DnaJ [Bacillus cereus]
MENYYELLQVDSNIGADELKEKLIEAQRKWLGRTNAPDLKRRQEAERKIEILAAAEEILLDEAKRIEYNRMLDGSNSEGNTNDQEQFDDTTKSTAQELINEAWNLLEQERVADAIVVGKRVTENYGANAYGWAVLARAHYIWNEYDDAIYEYRKAIDIETNNDVFYYDLADVYFDHPRLSFEERLNHVEKLTQKALSIKPNERAYRFRMAVIARYRDNYDQAIDILRQLIETHGKDPSLGNELAYNYYYKCLTLLYAQESNGETYYSYISRESAEQGLILLREAKLYATDRDLLGYIQTFIDLGEKALQTKFLVGRFAILGFIPAIWFLNALFSFSFISLLISGALLYFVWKISRIPVWLDNKEVYTGQREQRSQSILNAIGVVFGKK